MGHTRCKKPKDPKERVPVPEGAQVYKDGRVIIYLKRGRKDRKRVVIGEACFGETDGNGRLLMYPNSKYEEYCKNDCAKARAGASGEVRAMPPDVIHVGLYILVLGIVYELGIYQILIDVYNAQIANAIIDLAMFYILIRQDDLNVMFDNMNEQLMFSIQSYSDTWYCDLFKHEDDPISVDDAHNKEFMIRWVRHVKEDLFEKLGYILKNVDLILDGTNWINQSKTNTEASAGKAKTGEITTIVGSMFCVIGSGKYKGMPLAYNPTFGSDPDSKTSKEMIAFLQGFGLTPESMLADRAFCTDDFMKGCEELLLPFILMMHDNYAGAQTMFNLYSDLIRWNYDYRIRGHGLTFGISEKGHKVFGPESKNPNRTANLGEFFNAVRSFASIKKLFDKLDNYTEALAKEIEFFEVKRRKRAQIANNGNAVENTSDTVSKDELIKRALKELDDAGIKVLAEYQDYLTIDYNVDDGKYIIVENTEALRKECNSYGYYCLVSSSDLTAQEMSDKYSLRDTAEKVFSAAKSCLGFDSFKVSGTQSYHGKLFSCFIAIIIRNRIEYECRNYSKNKVLDTNTFIARLNSITYKRSGSTYQYTGQTSTEQLTILARYGINEEMLKQLGDLVNARDNEKLISELSLIARTIPGTETGPKGKQPDNTSEASDSKVPSNDQPKKRGRSKGVKNKATVEKEAKLAEENKRRAEAGLPPLNPHPGSGRKKGSKNKKTLQLEEELVEVNKRRSDTGLPPLDLKQYKRYLKKLAESDASANESKQSSKPLSCSSADKPKRGGRTSGSINNKTLKQEEYDRQLSLETGIDIIGDNPPPRPWDNATRYAENKRRAKLRQQAEEIRKRNSKS